MPGYWACARPGMAKRAIIPKDRNGPISFFIVVFWKPCRVFITYASITPFVAKLYRLREVNLDICGGFSAGCRADVRRLLVPGLFLLAVLRVLRRHHRV